MNSLYNKKIKKINKLKIKNAINEDEFQNIKNELIYESSLKTENKNTLWGYFLLCLTKKYFCFQGRATRKEFFGFFLFYIISIFLIIFLIHGIFILIFINYKPKEAADFLNFTNNIKIISYIIFCFFRILLFFPFLSVFVRRLHDINKIGYWAISFIILSIINIFNINLNILPAYLSTPLVIFLIITTVFVFYSSYPSKNKYGSSPFNFVNEKLNNLDLLEEAFELKEKNLITEQEFKEKKEELLKDI